MGNKWEHSGTKNAEITAREEKHRCFARRAAEEGIVLLKNDRILPIADKTPIALLGSGAGKVESAQGT